MKKFLADLGNIGRALMHTTQTVGEAFDVPPVAEGALVSEYSPDSQASQQPLRKVLTKGEVTDYLTDLWLSWARGNRVERFGQYVVNRTAVRGDTRALYILFHEIDPKRAYVLAEEYLQLPTTA